MRKFCSRNCAVKGRELKSRKITVICDQCKKEFKRFPSRKQRYCSKQCAYDSINERTSLIISLKRILPPIRAKHSMSEPARKRLSNAMKGDNNPAKRPEVRRKISKKKSLYWSNPDNRAKVSGENSRHWKGGISKNYCEKWNERLRESVREQFNRKCFICGTSERDDNRKLAVHHINFDKQAGCYGKRWNLIPLCVSHHGKTTVSNRWYWFNLLNCYWLINPDITINSDLILYENI